MCFEFPVSQLHVRMSVNAGAKNSGFYSPCILLVTSGRLGSDHNLLVQCLVTMVFSNSRTKACDHRIGQMQFHVCTDNYITGSKL